MGSQEIRPPEIAQQIDPDWRKNEATYWAARDFLEVLPTPTDKHQSVLQFLFLACEVIAPQSGLAGRMHVSTVRIDRRCQVKSIADSCPPRSPAKSTRTGARDEGPGVM
jgi:hypothetical protein